MENQRTESRTMRRTRRLYALALCLVCLAINILGVKLALGLKLPLFLDNIGSALAAAVGGNVPGMAVGFLTNLVNGISDVSTVYYASLTVLIAIFSCWFARRDYYNFRKPGKLLVVIVTFALIGGGLGSLLTWTLYGFGESLSGAIQPSSKRAASLRAAPWCSRRSRAIGMR